MIELQGRVTLMDPLVVTSGRISRDFHVQLIKAGFGSARGVDKGGDRRLHKVRLDADLGRGLRVVIAHANYERRPGSLSRWQYAKVDDSLLIDLRAVDGNSLSQLSVDGKLERLLLARLIVLRGYFERTV